MVVEIVGAMVRRHHHLPQPHAANDMKDDASAQPMHVTVLHRILVDLFESRLLEMRQYSRYVVSPTRIQTKSF